MVSFFTKIWNNAKPPNTFKINWKQFLKFEYKLFHSQSIYCVLLFVCGVFLIIFCTFVIEHFVKEMVALGLVGLLFMCNISFCVFYECLFLMFDEIVIQLDMKYTRMVVGDSEGVKVGGVCGYVLEERCMSIMGLWSVHFFFFGLFVCLFVFFFKRLWGRCVWWASCGCF